MHYKGAALPPMQPEPAAMKSFLLTSSLLVTSFLASTIKPRELSTANVSGIMDNKAEMDEKEIESLVANFLHIHPRDLESFSFDQLTIFMRGAAKSTCNSFTSFEMIPLRFFKDPAHVAHFIRGFGGKNIDELVEFLTPKQFNEVVGIAHNFPEISVEALNNLDSSLLFKKEMYKLPEYIKYVTPAFLDLIFSHEGVHQEPHDVGTLSRNIIELIPKKVLMETKSEIFAEIRSKLNEAKHADGHATIKQRAHTVVKTEQKPAVLMQEVRPLADRSNQTIFNILLLICILFLLYCTA